MEDDTSMITMKNMNLQTQKTFSKTGVQIRTVPLPLSKPRKRRKGVLDAGEELRPNVDEHCAIYSPRPVLEARKPM
jgi:hypothetical protein